MQKRVNLYASILVLVLTSASALAQTQSKPEVVKAEPRDLPARFVQRSPRLNTRRAPHMKSQLEFGNAGLFARPLSHLARPNEATILQTQAGGSTSWPQWGGDPQHASSINVAGQSFDAILAEITYDPNEIGRASCREREEQSGRDGAN